MNKYPFSKKAINAILAATVTLSPILATGTTMLPSKVQAIAVMDVNHEIDTLAERFFIFYKNAGNYGFTSTPSTSINSLTYDQINAKATANGLTLTIPPEKQADFTALMKNTSTLIYTNYPNKEALAAAVKQFRTDNADHFNTLFEESGDITAEQLIKFVKDLEGQLELAIIAAAMGTTTPTYANVLSTAVHNTFLSGANKADYANLNGKLSKFGLSVEGLFKLQDALNNSYVDPNKAIRSAMMQSAFAEKGASIVSDAQGYGLTVVINGNFPVTLKGTIQWQTSNSAVATFNGNKLTPVSTGTVDVYAMYDGIKLATLPNVSFTGPTPEPPPPDPGRNPQLPPKSTEILNETNDDGQKVVVTSIPDNKVDGLVNLVTPTNNTILINLEVPKEGEQVKAQVPADLFTEAEKKNPDAVVEIKTENASYKLPASEIAKFVGSTSDVKINISVNVVKSTEIIDGKKVVSKVIEFTVEAVSGGKIVPIDTFSTYVERSITGDHDFDSNNNVGVKITEDGVTPVPTLFSGKDATFKSLTNSQYTVIENHANFQDVDNNEMEKYIETLASKLIIKGKTKDIYAPGEEMTRAQFTVLLVRALGLPNEKEKVELKFKDVKEDAWYNLNGELAAAMNHGIIKGKSVEQFSPNEKITRSQVANMLYRAMNLIKYDTKQLDETKTISVFKDLEKMDGDSRKAIERVYQADIIPGNSDSTFNPNGKIKRDEMAKILADFLISAKLMNEIK